MPATRRRPRRVALFGHFGAGNLGNDGSLEVVLDFLRRERPDADLVCICTNPEATERAFGVRAIPIGLGARRGSVLGRLADIVRAFRRVLQLDAIVIPGTGIFDDFSDRPGGMPYLLCKWLLPARLLGCKIIMLSVGAGPIADPKSRRLMVMAARSAHYRSFRDALSRDFLASEGVDVRHDPLTPDLAFALRPPEQPAVPHDRLTVGLGVMDYWGWSPGSPGAAALHEAYVLKLTAFAQRVLGRGHRIRFLIGHVADTKAIAEMIERLGPAADRSLIVHEPAADLHALMRQILETDVVVATRFHNVVCALNVATPVISVSYAAKNDTLLDEAGLEGCYQHCETIDVDRLCEQLDRMLAARAELAAIISLRVADFRRRLAEQNAALLQNWL